MRQIPHTSDKGKIVIFVIDIVLESGARGRKQTVITRIFNRVGGNGSVGVATLRFQSMV